MYANKVNGSALSGEHLSSQLDFFTLTTTADLTNSLILDKLVEIISQKGQPVIMGTPSAPASGVTTFKFATEHTGAWTVADLKAAIVKDGFVNTFNYNANGVVSSVTTDSTLSASTVTVTVGQTL